MSDIFKHITVSVLGAFFVTGFIFFAGGASAESNTSFLLSEQTLNIITEAENALFLVNDQILDIESNGSLPNKDETTLEVSFEEISNKLRLSKILLDESKVYFDGGEYSKAAIFAANSRQNSLLTKAYFEGLKIDGGNTNYIKLKLQGTIEDIISLKSILGFANNLAPVTDVIESATTTDPIITEESPTLNPKTITCIENGTLACQNQETNCITKVSTIVNTCQTSLENSLLKCEVYLDRSETRLAKCDVNLNTCLLGGKKPSVCERRFTSCQVKAASLRDRDLDTYRLCKEASYSKKDICDLAYDAKIATKLETCKTSSLTCQSTKEARCLDRFQ